jgi:hypothetical protein
VMATVDGDYAAPRQLSMRPFCCDAPFFRHLFSTLKLAKLGTCIDRFHDGHMRIGSREVRGRNGGRIRLKMKMKRERASNLSLSLSLSRCNCRCRVQTSCVPNSHTRTRQFQ